MLFSYLLYRSISGKVSDIAFCAFYPQNTVGLHVAALACV